MDHCPVCSEKLSDGSDLLEHFRSSCKSSGYRRTSSISRTHDTSTTSSSEPLAHAGASASKQSVNVIFKWLPHRSVSDRNVHLFGDKSLNRGNPLRLDAGASGNFSSMKIPVDVGEYSSCQLALEEGDMLALQSFLVTERTTVVYLFTENKFDLLPSQSLLSGMHQSNPLSAYAQHSDSSDGELSSTAASGHRAPALPHHNAGGVAGIDDDSDADRFYSAVGGISDDLDPRGQDSLVRRRPDGAATASSEASSTPASSTLYRELLLHQIGQDDSLISRQVLHESERTHAHREEEESHTQPQAVVPSARTTSPASVTSSVSTAGTANTAGNGRTGRSRMAMRARHGNTAPVPIASTTHQLFTPLGDSRPLSSSLGNLRRGTAPLSNQSSVEVGSHEPVTSRSSILPRVTQGPTLAAAWSSPRQGSEPGTGSASDQQLGQATATTHASEAVAGSLPHATTRSATSGGRQTFVISDIRVLRDASALPSSDRRQKSQQQQQQRPNSA
eukprot:scpid72421/ scgid9864/ 